jgi:hypothetical protein
MVFRIICGDGKHTPQFDEQIRLFYADNQQQAFQKAQAMGTLEENSFMNIHQQQVQWHFVGITALYTIPTPADGIEIASCIKEVDDVENYVYYSKKGSTGNRSQFITNTNDSAIK